MPMCASLLESIALLDVMVNSFAHLVTTHESGLYCRPELTGMNSL